MAAAPIALTASIRPRLAASVAWKAVVQESSVARESATTAKLPM